MEVPQDIKRTADAEIAKGDMAFITVARAILAERKRCAEVARDDAKGYRDNGIHQGAIGAFQAAKAIEAGT